MHGRAWRLAFIVWLGTAFFEFMGPFNVLHQPPLLGLLSLGFWAVAALAQAYASVLVLKAVVGRPGPTKCVPLFVR